MAGSTEAAAGGAEMAAGGAEMAAGGAEVAAGAGMVGGTEAAAGGNEVEAGAEMAGGVEAARGVRRVRFGIMTAPMQVGYQDIQQVWRDADGIPEIEHAWLFDHLMPIGGDPGGPALEGWTLLAALAAQTRRLRLGLLVTSNRFRPPAILAKIATTVDIVSGGRLDFGIGAGSRPSHPMARREYEAHGLPYHDFASSVAALDEACTVIRRLWTGAEPFDFRGEHVQLTGAFGSPKPVQRPHPPIMIGGRSSALLRVVAEHADLWNIPGGGDITDVVGRSVLLDRYCAEIGRDPATITRSIHLPVSYDRPADTRDKIREAIDAGFGHIILGLTPPYPSGVAEWTADELISPTAR
ncbi:LLM class flavin-dependent oxidoreductase [Actinoplanes sichuanensis]|uniref:LLM class flavin-dependent oxidoreductase n=1 Tax=Actinoplanes sichuanensis TaxID=512349 RepID=A0ABW4AMX8_9ACTN|nr:LLM class flavin-dependent oxidoreductase [Actinoplanes sichuanensis]BEL06879.1 LLM class flavin-dependent oxidoreductase [Actinoplanes sichuanensis]